MRALRPLHCIVLPALFLCSVDLRGQEKKARAWTPADGPALVLGLARDGQCFDRIDRVTVRFETSNGPRSMVFDPQVAERQLHEAIRFGRSHADEFGRVPRAITLEDGTRRRLYREGEPFQLHDAQGAAVPIWWVPAADSRETGATHRETVERLRAGHPAEPRTLPGVWIQLDDEMKSVWQGGEAAGPPAPWIAKVRVSPQAHGPGFRLVLEVRREDQAHVESFTGEHVGRTVCLIADGMSLVEPIVQGSLSATIQIAPGREGWTREEAKSLARKLVPEDRLVVEAAEPPAPGRHDSVLMLLPLLVPLLLLM